MVCGVAKVYNKLLNQLIHPSINQSASKKINE